MALQRRVSDAEWKVMDLLWNEHPLTSRQVVDRLAAKGGAWHSTTIKTLLSRLVSKGFARYRAMGKRYLYSPAVSRERCVRQEASSFVERVFSGDPGALLAHFVDASDLSSAELRELELLLQRRRKEAADQ